MPRLLQLMHDQDAVCRAKALLALSCLIRLSPLALEVFRQKQGVPKLIEAASDPDVKVQRWAKLPRLHCFCPPHLKCVFLFVSVVREIFFVCLVG